MSFLAIFVQAVQSLRHRRGAFRPRKRAGIGLEQLDHRQLLAVNFTGNVLTDFPVTQTPGVVYVADPNNQVPLIPTNLQGPPFNPTAIVHVSGFQIDQVALSYDATTDTLSVGLLQPNSGINAFPVIAGDADDNGNNSTTSPAAAAQGVTDDPGISQAEFMAVVLDLSNGTNTANASIFAGIPEANSTPGYPNSTYVVAPAVFPTIGGVPNTNALPNPQQGGELTANEGNIYVPFNDPRHGALEFSILHFSQLFLQETGQPLTASSNIRVSAFAGSGDDDGISEQVFHFQPLNIGNATQPVPPVPPPPPPVIVELFQPTILINPHQNRHINTAHQTLVRVTVLSSASFDARQIDPSTVRFGGAAPIASFTSIVLKDGLYSQTFIFRGTDINLPPGFTVGTITGRTFGGVEFTGAELIFNRNDSFYSQNAIRGRDLRLFRQGLTVAQENSAAAAASAASGQASAELSAQMTQAGSLASSPDLSGTPAPSTVKITPRQALLARAEARKAAMMATIAARSFQNAPSTTPPVPTSSPNASALLAHDLALQSLTSGTAQSAT